MYNMKNRLVIYSICFRMRKYVLPLFKHVITAAFRRRRHTLPDAGELP